MASAESRRKKQAGRNNIRERLLRYWNRFGKFATEYIQNACTLSPRDCRSTGKVRRNRPVRDNKNVIIEHEPGND
jgi:hypothetical protein